MLLEIINRIDVTFIIAYLHQEAERFGKFGHKLYEATYVEMLHLYQRTRCKPIKVEDFNPRERKIAL